MAKATKPDLDEVVARRYWAALAMKDADAMAMCYAPDATFEDEVFQLRGAECGMMWRMLFQGAADLRTKAHPLEVGDGVAHGVWEAWYTFTATGRPVHNRINTRLVLRDGAIVDQKDEFAFYKWSRMALGAQGWALGWTPLLRAAVRKQARKRLDKWMAAR